MLRDNPDIADINNLLKTPEPKLLKNFQNSILDMLTWFYCWGAWSERVFIQPEIRQNFSNLRGGNYDLFGLKVFSELAYPFTYLPFDEALRFFSDKIPTLVNQLQDPESDLGKKLRAKAFYVGDTTFQHTTDILYNTLQKAYKEGIGVKQWLSQNLDTFNNLGFNVEKPYYLENVYRTNSSIINSAGHYQTQNEPVVAELLPNLRYVAINDARTRTSHLAMDGVLLPKDHPFWSANYPPNGYQCRCTVIVISNRTMQRRGLEYTPKIDSNAIADDGWRYNVAATYFEKVA